MILSNSQDQTFGETADDAEADRPGNMLVCTLFSDTIAPIALYYILRSLGAEALVALLAGSMIPMLHVVVRLIQKRPIGRIAVFVASLFVVAALASLVTGNPRLTLIKGGVISAMIAGWMIVTLSLARPFTYRVMQELLPSKSRRLENLWDYSPAFRRVWRLLAIIWACGVLADSAVRFATAFTMPVDVLPAFNAGLGIATFVILQLVTHFVLRRRRIFRMIFAP